MYSIFLTKIFVSLIGGFTAVNIWDELKMFLREEEIRKCMKKYSDRITR